MSTPSIFITGAASGIGRETAKYFHARGYLVGIFDIDTTGIESLKAELGDRCVGGLLDVTDQQSIEKAFELMAVASGGSLHVLFNCAGLLWNGPFEEPSLDFYQRMLAVNNSGMMQCTYTALPLLKEAAARAYQPVVINMSSASAVYGTPHEAVYSASKFWVKGFTEALEIEWRDHGIRCCDIMPPFVNTPMVQNANRLKSMDILGIKLTAEDIAPQIWKAAHGKKVHYPMTLDFRFLVAIEGFLPKRLTRFVMAKLNGF
ncbi:SDR family oxidoreductase [Parendozoicomonas haliclonae]|uniref:2,5-dichloro-2,5-cyclohexadiene-1,4-diol dehydrogenase n=1 Tax=Parendozoicomonas haliclonae TaxID=1960125 RepID=A0A1X7AR42_9GAMM|nr:SDR family oxidoreductase [Parendozoicomonas haliclonae]SMA50558.1 2,5-dichloro-2,5-cyclohexadiene-1,4-diol dehydrogenase [Parendozoicomonas haliclonae]